MSLAQRITERISETQQRIVANKDALAAHLEKMDDSNVSDTDLETTTTLNEKIAQDNKLLESYLNAEKNLAAGSVDHRSHLPATIPPPAPRQTETVFPRGPIPHASKKEVSPLDLLVRAGVITYLMKGLGRSADEIRINTYGEDEPTKAVFEWATRAASAPAQTNVAGWAQELVQQVVSDFMQLLQPQSVFPRLSGKGIRLNFGRYGKIIIPTRNATPTIAGSFVGEGAPIPVRQGAFSSQTLVPKKMAVISTWTRELDDHSIPAIEGLLRDAIQQDTANSIDAVLLDNNAATAIRPAGILNGLSTLTPTAAGGINALIGDLKLLSNALLTATNGNVRTPAFLMNPVAVNNARLTQAPNTGNFTFRDEIDAGRINGWPIIDSGNVPVTTMIAIDAADFVSVGGDGPRFEITDQATLHMEDTTPLAISTPGTPNTVAAPVRSLWQTDSLALRLVLPLNWTIRRAGVVAFISGITW